MSNEPGELTVTWEGNANATRYTLLAYYSDGKDYHWSQPLDGVAVSVAFTDLLAGRYYVTVIAHQQTGDGYVDATGYSNGVRGLKALLQVKADSPIKVFRFFAAPLLRMTIKGSDKTLFRVLTGYSLPWS